MHNMHTTRSYHSSTTRVVCVHTIDSSNMQSCITLSYNKYARARSIIII